MTFGVFAGHSIQRFGAKVDEPLDEGFPVSRCWSAIFAADALYRSNGFQPVKTFRASDFMGLPADILPTTGKRFADWLWANHSGQLIINGSDILSDQIQRRL